MAHGVVLGVLGGEHTLVDHVLDLGVVAGEAAQDPVAQAVDAAVADPQAGVAAAVGDHDGGGGPHALADALGLVADDGVGVGERGLDGLDVGLEGAAELHLAEGADDGGGGPLAVLVAAHAVGHGPQAHVVAQQVGVFVDAAHEAFMGETRRQESELGSHAVFQANKAHANDGCRSASGRRLTQFMIQPPGSGRSALRQACRQRRLKETAY